MTNTLAKRITQASIDAGLFLADKRNTDQNYAYISADQVLTKAGDALARNGVMVLPQVVDIQMGIVERPNKSPRLDAHVQFDMLITDDESELHARWDGFGSDYMTPDKAVYKAITSGHKYFLMKLLNIGVGNEDGEHETLSAPERGNPNPANAKLREAWDKLAARADAVGISHAVIDWNKATADEVIEAGKELRPLVEDAEAQAANVEAA